MGIRNNLNIKMVEEKNENFPCEPAFLIPVEIKDVPEYGPGHKGVFATEFIPKGTKIWEWTDRVHRINKDEINSFLEENFATFDERALAVRQGFVLASDMDHFNHNPTDAGRFTNHSSNPTAAETTLRDVQPGE